MFLFTCAPVTAGCARHGIYIQFRRALRAVSRHAGRSTIEQSPVLHIQPDEGISMRVGAKIPGPILKIGAVDLNFDYEDYFGNTPSTGYERLYMIA